ncbi:MAG: CPBP family intramembrane metalloprotease [Anaerolineales bacterium]|nr:CPBP family intramembrane metalloprotease [Anaerolineales bacterium]
MTPTRTPAWKPRALFVFFALAFGLSWAAWIPLALASRGWLGLPFDATLLALIGAFGPCLAALLTAALCDGRAGLGDLLRRLTVWRVGLVWYLFALAWPALLSLATTGLHLLLGGAAPDFSRSPFHQLYPLPPELKTVSPLAFLPAVFLQQTLLGSSMGEEPGWRGYALPRLLERFGPLWSSILLGALWVVWHLPLSFVAGDAREGSFTAWTALGTIATAVIFTWLYQHTRGSLLLALLLHTAIAVTGLFLPSAAAHPAVGALLTCGAALLLAAASGWLRLTPGRPALAASRSR